MDILADKTGLEGNSTAHDYIEAAAQYRDYILRYYERSFTKTLLQGYIYRFLKNIFLQDETDLHKRYIGLGQYTIATLSTFNCSPESKHDIAHFTFHQLQDLMQTPSGGLHQARLLFLGGHLTGSWISAIGAKYKVAPEYFRRHVHIWKSSDGAVLYAVPNLPSVTASAGMALRMYSFGGNSEIAFLTKTLLSRSTVLPQTAHHAEAPLEQPPGSSYLRCHAIINDSLFLLEQEISIIIRPHEQGWTVVIWSDAGSRGLLESQGFSKIAGQLGTDPMTAAKSMYFDSTPILGIDTEIKQPIPQGDYDGGHPGLSHNNLTEPSTHLPKEHHLFLDHAIAAQDPIYALYPIFRFTASSAKQAMSMITQQYEIISSTRWDRSLWRTHLDQLVLQKHILDDHVCQHQAALRFWTSSDHEHWTKTLTTDQAKTATKAKDSISDDYEYLIQRCRALSDHHSTAINILTATASLAEAEESIQVAKQVTKLTVLATIFLPLSFCASIFGMNFRELNNLSIWIWIVVTVVTGIATLVTYRWSDRHLVSTAVKKKWNEYSKPSGVQTRFSSSAKFSGV